MDLALNSNSGRETLRLADIVPDETGRLRCRFVLERRPLTGGPPVSVVIEGLALRRDSLIGLRDTIDSWLRSFDDRIEVPLEGTFALGTGFEESITLTFGQRPDTIADRKQTAHLQIRAMSFHAEATFSTDQSCLRLLLEDLQALAL